MPEGLPLFLFRIPWLKFQFLSRTLTYLSKNKKQGMFAPLL